MDQLKSVDKQILAKSALVASLEEQIRRDIPREARRAVLLDRLSTELVSLNQYASSVSDIRRELADLGTPADLPPLIAAAVEHEIDPAYVARQYQSRLRTYLLILTAGAAITASVLSNSLGRWLALGSLGGAAVALALLAWSVLGPRSRSRRVLSRLAVPMFLVSGVVQALAGTLLMLFGPGWDDTSLVVGLAITTRGILTIVTGGLVWVWRHYAPKPPARQHKAGQSAAESGVEQDAITEDPE